MSYESMAREEVGCDFPGCSHDFDMRPGARVAGLRYKDIVAFCAQHSSHLLAQGVNLRAIEVVRREWNILLGRPIPPTPSELQAQEEQAFIRSLK